MSARDKARLRWMFPQLNITPPEPPPRRELTPEERMWSLRGEPRTRATFGLPHPQDFPGGLPLPGEYPRR